MIETLTTNTNTIYAAFPEVTQAERAAGALLDHGVLPSDISIVSTEGEAEYQQSVEDMTAEGGPAIDVDEEVSERWNVPPMMPHYPDAHMPDTMGITTTTGGDAAAGAAKGAGIGLGLGAIAALSCIIVPGVGLVLGGGVLAAAIGCAAGTAAAGAVAGGIHGFLVDQGMPAEAAERLTEAYHAGDTIICVTLPSNGVDEMTADQILTKYHGNHISAFRQA